MHDVAVRILHPDPGPAAGPLEQLLIGERRANAERHAAGFTAAGAADVRIVAGPPDDTPFGRRLRALVGDIRGGLVILGSGAIPLATRADRRAFVDAAGSHVPRALANNRYSADVVALSRAADLSALPDLVTDNALPRWLEEAAGYTVADLRGRWRLGVDVDSPLDLVLLGRRMDLPGSVRDRLGAVAAVADDARAELVVAGRTGTAALAWLERATRARVRAIVEERGLRTREAGQRAARSLLGMVVDRDGPECLGPRLAELGDAALVDSRVLLAHRFGADERDWPPAEDRYASDLLLSDRIGDPWLRALTESAAAAPIPIVLGGHSLVGPGVRLALRRSRARL